MCIQCAEGQGLRSELGEFVETREYFGCLSLANLKFIAGKFGFGFLYTSGECFPPESEESMSSARERLKKKLAGRGSAPYAFAHI